MNLSAARKLKTPIDVAEAALGLGWVVLILCIWAAIVALGIYHHEYWRDEVRALTMAVSASHLWTLPQTIQGESHPVVWYALLWTAYGVFGTKQVLPLVSVVVAATALAIFLLRAPFALWWKLLFVFSGLPLYEYVVMSRNYGISMLLMFAFAALLAGQQRKPLYLGAVLFLLAQTNVHSALLTIFLAFAWFCVWRDERQSMPPGAASASALAVGMAIAALGLICTLLTILPSRHTQIVNELSHSSYAGGAYLKGLALAVVEPGFFYRKLTSLPALAGTVLLYLGAIGLAYRRGLLASALGGLWATSAFFALVFNSGYRHQGLWLIFLITLYWIGISSDRRVSPVRTSRSLRIAFSLSIFVAIPLTLLMNIATGYRLIDTDLHAEMSKSKALGEYILSHPALRGAVIVAQPDPYVESVNYYVDNESYLIRDRMFGRLTTLSSDHRAHISLGDLMREAQQIQTTTGRPLIFIVQHPLTDEQVGSQFDEYFGMTFAYSAQELRAFREATTKIPLGHKAAEEDFEAYVLNQGTL